MYISKILQKPSLSFEVFPPKQAEGYERVSEAALKIAALRPSFMSVTCGAGGTAPGQYTLDIARKIQAEHQVPALAHLTCVGASKEQVQAQLAALKQNGIKNILALRGDIPQGYDSSRDEYPHAADLLREISLCDSFCAGAACYPEGHVENPSPAADRRYLKEKQDAGAQFFTTQMFFDNALLYKFLYQIREIGVTVPVVAGIMPVTNGKQIERICRLSGTYLPARFKAILDKFGATPEAMQRAGILYASEQIVDLFANGVTAVHVYSMNKPAVAAEIQANLKEILPYA